MVYARVTSALLGRAAGAPPATVEAGAGGQTRSSAGGGPAGGEGSAGAGGIQRLYTMFGDHGHELIVTADEFAQLASGQPLQKVSTSSSPGAHVHDVSVQCVRP